MPINKTVFCPYFQLIPELERVCMALFLPFCAVHYNQEKFPKMNDFVSPPYDMVGDELKKKLMNEYYNYVHLILPTVQDLTNYKIATHSLFGWLMRDVLVVDKIPSYYIHEKVVRLGGVEYRRYGIIGLMRIEDYGNVVKKIEKTDEKYINDRYLLQKETESNLEPIFALYRDKQNAILTRALSITKNMRPVLELTDLTGDVNRLYKIEDIEFSKQVYDYFSDKSVYIVDGQHRYEAALKYRAEMMQALGDKFTGNEPFNYVMMDVFNASDPSTRVFPVNRLIRKSDRSAQQIFKALDGNFRMAAIAFRDAATERMAREKLRQVLNEQKARGLRSLGLYHKDVPNRYFILTAKDAAKAPKLDVDLVDTAILQPVLGIPKENYGTDVYYRSDYGSNFNGALDLVRSGEYSVAVILNQLDPDTVLNMADAKAWLPSKSVNFYPKVFSGLTLFSYRYSTFKVY